jgi:hypothetical protein
MLYFEYNVRCKKGFLATTTLLLLITVTGDEFGSSGNKKSAYIIYYSQKGLPRQPVMVLLTSLNSILDVTDVDRIFDWRSFSIKAIMEALHYLEDIGLNLTASFCLLNATCGCE